MVEAFKLGDTKQYSIKVKESDTASFESGQVHPVYATFALGRDAEWCCRLFVLEMKEEHEEGIGTSLSINHHSPALLHQEVLFTATVSKLEKNSIICTYEAHVGKRLIASGEQGQKIIAKSKLNHLFNTLAND